MASSEKIKKYTLLQLVKLTLVILSASVIVLWSVTIVLVLFFREYADVMLRGFPVSRHALPPPPRFLNPEQQMIFKTTLVVAYLTMSCFVHSMGVLAALKDNFGLAVAYSLMMTMSVAFQDLANIAYAHFGWTLAYMLHKAQTLQNNLVVVNVPVGASKIPVSVTSDTPVIIRRYEPEKDGIADEMPDVPVPMP